MSYFKSMDISGSALTAERFRMDVIAENIANATNTRAADGQPYRRRFTIFQERESDMFSSILKNQNRIYSGDWNSYAKATPYEKENFAFYYENVLRDKRSGFGNGVRVTDVGTDPSPFNLKYDPTHPDAGEDGYVRMPNVDVVTEMVDMISATRSYEANVTALNAFKDMAVRALQIGK